MNENILGFIKWAAGIAITLAIISIAFLIFKNSEKTVLSVSDNIGEINTQIMEGDVLKYDDMEVSGSEIIYAIKSFKEDYIGVQVITGKNSGGTWYGYNVSISSGVASIGAKSSASLSQALNETSNEYINTGGKFIGKVYRDANGTIAAVTFTQR